MEYHLGRRSGTTCVGALYRTLRATAVGKASAISGILKSVASASHSRLLPHARLKSQAVRRAKHFTFQGGPGHYLIFNFRSWNIVAREFCFSLQSTNLRLTKHKMLMRRRPRSVRLQWQLARRLNRAPLASGTATSAASPSPSQKTPEQRIFTSSFQPTRCFHSSRKLQVVKPVLLADIGEGAYPP